MPSWPPDAMRRPSLVACLAVKGVIRYLAINPHLTSNAKEGRPWLLGQVPNELCPRDAPLGESTARPESIPGENSPSRQQAFGTRGSQVSTDRDTPVDRPWPSHFPCVTLATCQGASLSWDSGRRPITPPAGYSISINRTSTSSSPQQRPPATSACAPTKSNTPAISMFPCTSSSSTRT